MVRDRTNDMVLHTMMRASFCLESWPPIFWLLLASRLVSGLTSNMEKASLTVGSPVGILLVTMELKKGNAFPAVNVSGLFLLTNPVLYLILT